MDDIEARKTLVFELMLQGYRVPQIMSLIAANRLARDSKDAAERARYRPELDWNVQERQVREYYREASAMLRDEFLHERKDEFIRTRLQFEDLYRRCLQVGDMTNARHLLKDRRLLLGLNDFDHGGDGGQGKGGTVDERVTIKLPGGLSVDL